MMKENDKKALAYFIVLKRMDDDKETVQRLSYTVH